MDSSADHLPVIFVEDLEINPGRHSIHCEPDFCGRMNVVLDEKSPDRLAFTCTARLVVGETYTIATGTLGDSRPRSLDLTKTDSSRPS
jgi:hypothetical protein